MSSMLKQAVTAALAAALSLAAASAAVAKELIPNQYIVVLKKPSGLLPVSLNERAQTLLTQVGGGDILAQYQAALYGFAARITPVQAEALAKLPGVKLVSPDQVLRANATTQTGATWGLDRVDQVNMPLDGLYIYPTQAGQGVHIYVLDTGLNAAHSEFAGRVGTGRNFAPNTEGTVGQPLADIGAHPAQLGVPLNMGVVDILGTGFFTGPTDPNDTTDCNGHGTHVAGTAAGTLYGVAKQATVHAVRVLGCSGSGSTSGVLQGVDWVTANAQRPAVANMSLGGGNDAALDEGVRNAILSGISFAVAAGNSSADACSGSPNRLAEAITVGATQSNDAMASYSNSGPCLDIFAPGSSITSAGISGPNSTANLSGTSMASPHVAGAAALVLGANPNATPTQVRDALVGDATLGKITSLSGNSPNALLYVVH